MSPHYIIALKNIIRSKQRSIVTIVLSAVSTAILIFSTALMDGEHKVLLKSAVEIYPGYIQITHKEFRENPSFDNLIFDTNSVINKIRQKDDVDTVTSRFETFVLFATDEKSVGAMLAGIEPESEAKVSKLKKSLMEGSYLDSDDKNKVYIGSELANKLKVKVGDVISFIGTAADYSFCADNVKVKGIFQSGLFEFDANSAFLNKKYFDEIFVSSNISTHIIVQPSVIEDSLDISQDISKSIDKELTSKSWQEYMQALVDAMELDSVFGYITLGIFFIVIFFVVLIYTLLSIFSRIKEIGVLRAIGTSPKEILQMLMFESVVLSFVSVAIGGIIGGAVAYYFNINPIDFGSQFDEQFKQYGLVNTLFPTEFNLLVIFRDMAIMFFLNILSTLYPIMKVNRYNPVEAMHHV